LPSARHKIHVFFIEDNSQPPPMKGVYSIGATEIHVYSRDTTPLEYASEIREIIHFKVVKHSLSNAIEQVTEDFADLLSPDMLVCINLNCTIPVITQCAIIALSNFLSEFHKLSRPGKGRIATGMYYLVQKRQIHGFPIVPMRPLLCYPIVRILSHKTEWCSKDDLLEALNSIDDSVTKDQLTNALLILENWLALFPGFAVRQQRQRKKEYRISNLENL